MDLSQDRKRLDSYFCKPSAATTSSTGFGGGTSSGGTPRKSEAPSSVPTPAAKRMRNIAGGAAGARKASTASALTGTCKRRSNEQLEESAAHNLGEVSEEKKWGFVVSPRPPPLRCLGALPAPAAEAGIIDLAAGTTRTADKIPDRETRLRGVSGGSSPVTAAGPLVVDSVDVEAQKAILADIERRNRLRSVQLSPPPPSPREGTPKSDKATTIKMESTMAATVPNPYATTPGVRRTEEGRGEREQLAGRPQKKQPSEADAAVPAAVRGGRRAAVTKAVDVENRRPLSSLTGRGRRGGTSAAGRGGRGDSKASGKTAARGSTSTSSGTPDTGRGSGGKFGGRGGGRSLGKGRVANSSNSPLFDGGAVSAGIEVAREGDGKGRRDSSSPATIRHFFGRGGGPV